MMAERVREAGSDFWRTQDLRRQGCRAAVEQLDLGLGPCSISKPNLTLEPNGCQPAKVHMGPDGDSNSLMYP